jgi:hypothetical protein
MVKGLRHENRRHHFCLRMVDVEQKAVVRPWATDHYLGFVIALKHCTGQRICIKNTMKWKRKRLHHWFSHSMRHSLN